MKRGICQGMLWLYLSCSLTALAGELLGDPGFQQGYSVISPERNIYTDRARQETIHLLSDQQPGITPAWRLLQWGSDLSLANVKPVPTAAGGKRWALTTAAKERVTAYKSISIEPHGEVTLELNALANAIGPAYLSYDKADLYLNSLDERWPHLLLAQNIQTLKLDQYRELNLSLDARLLFDHKNISEGYRPSIHAARFPIAMAVRNTLSGNMFWLSLVVYDDRHATTGFSCQKCLVDPQGMERCTTPSSLQDPGRWECPFDGKRWSASTEKKGTRKMIFRIPTQAASADNIQAGQWAHYQVNLLPYIIEAVKAARETRDLGGFSPDLRFYELGFFSMGWEITGHNHAALSIKNLSLKGS